jgi:dienelactone hydrolase
MDEAPTITAASAAPLRAQEVVIPGPDGLALGGTLVRPPRLPAMLLLQGSGPLDRDGNIPGTLKTDLLKQVAEALAKAGVASLRYDKRGEYANKAQLPAATDARADFLSWDNFVEDAAAAWRFLRDQPGIDPQRVGIFGHSEGGVIALAAARQLLAAGEAPAALILAATPGRPMAEVLRQQLAQIMQQRRLKPDKTEQILATVDQIHREISETGQVPEQVPSGLKPLYKPEFNKYWQPLLSLDPTELAELFPGPVLIVEGTADNQVSARDDALNLDAALSERPSDDHDLLFVPRMSHALKPVDKPNARGMAGPIKPSLVNDITDWVKTKLGERAIGAAD